jgi:lysophospholipase L1-like esterase
VNTSKRWLLSAGVLALAVLVPEIALRLGGFEYRSGVQFGFPNPETMASFETDARLFWKLKIPPDPARARGDTAGNSRGFPGPDPAVPKPADAYRALFLGDSCTFQGYPWIAAERLRAEGVPKGKRAEAVSFAVPGYTSLQGLRAAESFGLEVDPDVVFVYFGWNDHWAAYGQIDSSKPIAEPKLSAALFERSRLAQATSWLAGKWLGGRKALDLPRVLPEEYRENLLGMRAIFAARGIPVVFLTAPTTFYSLGVPKKLVEDRFAKSEDSAIALHKQYNAIVREVAASSKSFLLDLESECDASPDLPRWFLKDGVHFSPDGRQWLAERITAFVRDRLLSGTGK